MWFFKPKIKRRVEWVNVNPLDINLDEWVKTPQLVDEFSKIQNTQIFKAVIATLKNESPANYTLPKIGTQPTDLISHLGEINGYNKCLNNLAAMGKLDLEVKPLVATFEPPETEELE